MHVESLLPRIRGEFLEMPGLRLTAAQARRLWDVDEPTCVHILHALNAEGFLRCLPDGSYVLTEIRNTKLRMTNAALASVAPQAQHRTAV